MHPSNGRVGGDEYVRSKITSLLASEAEKAKTLRSGLYNFFLKFQMNRGGASTSPCADEAVSQ